MPLYQISQNQSVFQIKPSSFKNEKELQTLFENNMEVLLGVRFVATEFTTGDRQRGRIDSLGLDEDNSPVIIEYKKSSKENVINQGLFYLDWLVDHKGDFTLVAQKALGKDVEISWSSPRVILIAERFSEYDKYAVNRIGANIELWTYRLYADEYIFLETIYAATSQKIGKKSQKKVAGKIEKGNDEEIKYTLAYHLAGKSKALKTLFDALQDEIFLLSADDDILEKPKKTYISYKHGKNFCEVKPQATSLKIWLDIEFNDLDDPKDIARDVKKIGHHGTGMVEIRLSSLDDLDDIMYLIEQSYRQTV
jgi:predicted transport protein